LVTAFSAKKQVLLFCFNAFGKHRQFEASGQRNSRAHDRSIVIVRFEVRNERAIFDFGAYWCRSKTLRNGHI
jgi:hypothetical protein